MFNWRWLFESNVGLAFVVVVVLLIVLFSGDPDLYDVLIYRMTK